MKIRRYIRRRAQRHLVGDEQIVAACKAYWRGGVGQLGRDLKNVLSTKPASPNLGFQLAQHMVFVVTDQRLLVFYGRKLRGSIAARQIDSVALTSTSTRATLTISLVNGATMKVLCERRPREHVTAALRALAAAGATDRSAASAAQYAPPASWPPPVGTWYLASDAKWYCWPDATPHASPPAVGLPGGGLSGQHTFHGEKSAAFKFAVLESSLVALGGVLAWIVLAETIQVRSALVAFGVAAGCAGVMRHHAPRDPRAPLAIMALTVASALIGLLGSQYALLAHGAHLSILTVIARVPLAKLPRLLTIGTTPITWLIVGLSVLSGAKYGSRLKQNAR